MSLFKRTGVKIKDYGSAISAIDELIEGFRETRDKIMTARTIAEYERIEAQIAEKRKTFRKAADILSQYQKRHPKHDSVQRYFAMLDDMGGLIRQMLEIRRWAETINQARSLSERQIRQYQSEMANKHKQLEALKRDYDARKHTLYTLALDYPTKFISDALDSAKSALEKAATKQAGIETAAAARPRRVIARAEAPRIAAAAARVRITGLPVPRIVAESQRQNQAASAIAARLNEGPIKTDVIEMLSAEQKETRLFKEAILPAITGINSAVELLNKVLAEQSATMTALIQQYADLDNKSEEDLGAIINEIVELQMTQEELSTQMGAFTAEIKNKMPFLAKITGKRRAEAAIAAKAGGALVTPPALKTEIERLQTDLNTLWSVLREWEKEYKQYEGVKQEQLRLVDNRLAVINKIFEDENGPLGRMISAASDMTANIDRTKKPALVKVAEIVDLLGRLRGPIEDMDTRLRTALEDLHKRIEEARTEAGELLATR